MLKGEGKETDPGDTRWKVGSKNLNAQQTSEISMITGIISLFLRYRKYIKLIHSSKNVEYGRGHALSRRSNNYLCPVFVIRCMITNNFLLSRSINNYD